jgi:sugar lactone lactonase YvrE
VLLGTELAGPNGIVVSEDNRYLYVAALGTRELVRFDLSQEPVASDAVTLDIILDNIRWGESGKLLTAGGNAGGNGWSVVEVDAASLDATRIGGMNGDAAMQRVSSALQVGDQIWVGTYSGDRVGYFARD